MPQSLAKILVHTVFSTKDRRPFLRDKPLREELHRYLGGILTNLDCQPIIIGGMEDHIHILSTLSRTCEAAETWAVGQSCGFDILIGAAQQHRPTNRRSENISFRRFYFLETKKVGDAGASPVMKVDSDYFFGSCRRWNHCIRWSWNSCANVMRMPVDHANVNRPAVAIMPSSSRQCWGRL